MDNKPPTNIDSQVLLTIFIGLIIHVQHRIPALVLSDVTKEMSDQIS